MRSRTGIRLCRMGCSGWHDWIYVNDVLTALRQGPNERGFPNA